MILADSILQTASMALCVLVAVTATHHTIFNLPAQAGRAAAISSRPYVRAEDSYGLGAKSSGPINWRTSVSPSHPGQCFL
jgi:hypothetical protein